MKEIIMDFTLVGLLLFCGNSLFNSDYISNEMLKQNITSFEKSIKDNEVIEYDEGVYDNNEESSLSILILKISEICIKIIQTIILLICQFISNIL